MGVEESGQGVMLIIYEVNLKIHLNSAAEFQLWLADHVREMLTFPGFNKANLYQNDDSERADCLELVVMYSVDSLESLNHYFCHHAAAMRQDGLTRFPEQFTATRRILHPVK